MPLKQTERLAQTDQLRSGSLTRTAGEPAESVLAAVGSPGDLQKLPAHRLPALAAEIRATLIEKVSASGGHLGPNLGVVELTIALHRVFDSPRDAIVFDTGHQSYVHKMLTGRIAEFDGLRQADCLSGYPCRAESPHDIVENSHASTALSWADGLAKGFELMGESDRCAVAVVGDGALTGGMSWEALNNIGGGHRPVIAVLNDNGRSYDPTIGGLAEHLAVRRARSPEEASPGGLFESLGFTCIGPVPGHDLDALQDALRAARATGGPTLVHVVTVKGKGHRPAETDEADRLHAVGVVDPATSRPLAASKPTWSSVFDQEIAELGAENEKVVCLSAAMVRPTGLHTFATRFPDRCFDVGIAEQHAVTSAAALSTAGLHPVVAIYSTFMNRAFDQVLFDVALHDRPVTFVLDRAGITGPDGASHHGMWDLSTFSQVPGMRIAVPRDPATLRALLREAVALDCPTLLRYPKATAGADLPVLESTDGVDVLFRSATKDVLLIAAGPVAATCVEAAGYLSSTGIGCTVVDPRWVVPVNPRVTALAAAHTLVVSVEDGNRAGGVGSLIAQACADAANPAPVISLGLPRAFLPHSTRPDLLERTGLTTQGIVRSVLRARADLPQQPAWRNS
ncbi:1-deoxy-D-xylulose-5-phosphate synthase [Streptomyces sp. NPDC055749]